MAIGKVFGIPTWLKDDSRLRHLVLDSIPKAIAAHPPLRVTPEDIAVFVPYDLVTAGLGEEVIIQVDDLPDQPELTNEVLRAIAESVLEAAVQSFVLPTLEVCERVHATIKVLGDTKFGSAVWYRNPKPNT